MSSLSPEHYGNRVNSRATSAAVGAVATGMLGRWQRKSTRLRARSALAVVKQHPGMVLFLASPAIVAVVAVWLLAGAGWAALLLHRAGRRWRRRAVAGAQAALTASARSPWENSAPSRL